MGAACCVAAKDATIPSRNPRDTLHKSGRNSPSWSFRRDNHCCVVDETDNLSHSPSDGTVLDGGSEIKGRLDLDSGNVSGGGTPSRISVTPASRKSPAYEGNTASTPSDASSLSNRFAVVNNPIGSPEISEAVSSKLPFFMSPPSFSTLRGGPGPSSSHPQLAQPSSTPSRRARRSPGHQLFRQISDSKILGLKSPNSNSGTSFLHPTFGNDLTTGSQGGSSDGWSLRTFSELVASSQRERWSFDSEHFGGSGRLKISGSSSRFSCSPSIDLRACGACSKLLSERACFVGDEVPVVAVLVCGHVYHAECLDNMVSEASKYDPPCPICTVGEKQVLKMSRKVMKAEAELKMRFHKKLKNRVMDSYFGNDLDNFDGEKSFSEQDKKQLHKAEASSSSKMPFGKPFLKRHFSLGSKWIRSASENDSAKRKGFWGKYRKD